MTTWDDHRISPGEEPELARMLDALRALQDTASGVRLPDDVAKQARRDLEQINRTLEPYLLDDLRQASGRGPGIAGTTQPLLPMIHVDEADDDRIAGRVTLGRFYLGGFGAAHGGAIPLVFDELLGRLANAGGRPIARTAYLNVNFRAVTPIDVELRLEARIDREEGRKRYLVGTLFDGDTPTADAEGLFIALQPGRS